MNSQLVRLYNLVLRVHRLAVLYIRDEHYLSVYKDNMATKRLKNKLRLLDNLGKL